MRPVFLLCCLATAVAWAPPTHPTPSKLPKALEFAEKAWRFPKQGQIHAEDAVALRTKKELENRIFPWSQQDDEDEEGCDESRTFFDRVGGDGDVLCWAYLMDAEEHSHATRRLTDHLTSHPGHEEFDEDCEDVYYDDSGDALCWVI